MGDGEIKVTDLDQSCFSVIVGGGVELDFPLRVEAAEDGGAIDKALAEHVKKSAVPLLKAKLAAFVAEMRAAE